MVNTNLVAEEYAQFATCLEAAVSPLTPKCATLLHRPTEAVERLGTGTSGYVSPTPTGSGTGTALGLRARHRLVNAGMTVNRSPPFAMS